MPEKVYFGELSVGYVSGWTAPALTKLQNPDETPLSVLITNGQASLLGSLTFIGVIIGVQIAGCLCNTRGRKPCLLLGGVIVMTAHLLLARSVELWMLFAGRLLLGMGAGLVFIVNLTYITEVSSKNIRGMLLTGTGIANASGTLVGYCIGPYIPFAAMSYVGFVIAMMFTAGALFIPETPVFYAMTGKEIEAKTTLVLLGRSDDIEDVLSSRFAKTRRDEWKSIYTVKSNRKAMIIATVLLVCQQTGGYVCVLYFGTSIFQSAGSSISPPVATIVIGMTQLVGSCITPLFVERVGRKILMLVTTVVCFFGLVTLGIYFCVQSLNPHAASQLHWLPLLCLMVFLLSYTIGFGIIPGTWMSEMFDSSARGPGSATAMTTSWIFGFLATSSFGYITSTLGNHWTFWIYSVSCAIAFVFTAVVVPETKGKSLTEIQYILIYIGQIQVGFGLGWSAPIIPKLQDPAQTPLPNVISDQTASWVGSLIYLGCITGPYVTNFLSNVTGRKPCLFIGGVITLLSFLVLALAKNLAMIFTGRILNGLGSGIIFVVNLVYIGEIASTNIRGILLTVTAIFTTGGTLIVYSVGPYVPYAVTNYIGMVVTLIYICGLFYIPESPLFLVFKGDKEKAKKTLIFLGRDEDIDIILSSKTDRSNEKNTKQWTEIFTIKSNRKALFITLTLNILQQMSGVIAVVFFATTIFKMADSSVDADIATIIIGITQITASTLTPFFVERAGRKSLLLISTGASCFSLGVLGTYFYLDGSPLAASVKWLPLVTLIVFFLSYDIGFGIIPGTLIGEMFTTNVRSSGATVTITIGWLVGFGVATAFGYMIQLGAYFTFWFYAAACAVAFTFTIIFVPETKGKSLFEVQEMLSR